MYPFWDRVILPVLQAADARRVVEIGALRGDTTVRMIKALGDNAELHVIDPVPEFDPGVHEARFPGQYVFHRDLSLKVLDHLPPMDAALIDGDHNWYTVYNECKALASVARAADRPMPVMLLHDVGWPYGRRDLYYDPSNIPEEHRQPYRRLGISRTTDELVPGGGFNKTLPNAIAYGGPRNGVMTGLEDFLAEHDRPYRLVMLPIYYGLAIVAEQETLDATPALTAFLDELEGPTGQADMIELSETIRLDAANLEQNFIAEYQRRIGVLADRYLATVRAALLNDIHPEQELRVAHLEAAVEQGTPVHPLTLNDPMRQMRPAADELRARHRSGTAPSDGDHGPLTRLGEVGLTHLHDALDSIRTAGLGGALVDCGTGRGGVGIYLRAYIEAHFLDANRVVVADRFRSDTPGDLNTVRDAFDRLGLLDERTTFLIGPPTEAFATADVDAVALLHIDGDGDDIAAALDRLYPALAIDGWVLVSTAGDDRAATAVDAFRDRVGESAPLHRFGPRLVGWRRAVPAIDSTLTTSTVPATPPHPPAPTGTCDLSMVVVFYDMQREAARTLRSLARGYQEGVDELDYEVIVVDNGSPDGRGLDRAFVESFGPQFRFHDLTGRSTSSPTTALNHGIAESRGDVIGLMIDGAHVLSPGVLREAMVGMRAYAPAAVSTQIFYVGPGQQSEAMAKGYDQTVEDGLFDAISWPDDGYKLFDIAHFQADRDWFDGMWESNCLFVSRATLDQLGGFDDSFDEPGGGYSNLEIFERVCAAPDINLVTVLGEASFHQTHGGTTNNQPSPEERFRRITEYGERYTALRGRPYSGPRTAINYVGSIRTNTRRTKARRMAAKTFRRHARPGDPEGPPLTSEVMADDLTADYLDGYWRELGWQQTPWLGREVAESADDLVVFQALIAANRPSWVIDLSTDTRERAFFLATICELLDSGEVLSICTGPAQDGLDHPRLRTIDTEDALTPEVLDAVREMVPARSAMVVLGSPREKRFVMPLFDAYADFVAIGCHAIVEWTAVNGHPIWSGFGPGPTEAVKVMRKLHPDFIDDPTVEGAGPSFHRGGYLKRVR